MGHAKMVKKSHVIAATRKNNFTYIYLYITSYIVDQLLVSKRTDHVDKDGMREGIIYNILIYIKYIVSQCKVIPVEKLKCIRNKSMYRVSLKKSVIYV